MTTQDLRRIASGVHVLERPQRFYGLEVGTRMTVLELDGGLLVHSPVAIDPTAVASLGTPRWVVAPSLFHHLHIGPWIDAGLEGWAAPGLPEKRRELTFTGVLREPTDAPFGDELAVLPLRCFPLSNEVVFYHRPSRTLLVTDLVYHLSASAPWLTRATFTCIGGYPGVRASLVERAAMQRAVAREEIDTILEWDFERIVLAHGDVVETDARDRFAAAYRWLR